MTTQLQKVCKQCVFMINNTCKLHKTVFPNPVNGQGTDAELMFVRMFVCRGSWFIKKIDEPLPSCPP